MAAKHQREEHAAEVIDGAEIENHQRHVGFLERSHHDLGGLLDQIPLHRLDIATGKTISVPLCHLIWKSFVESLTPSTSVREQLSIRRCAV
ncbi:MAG: hypothetical protein Ct9H300mP1_04660 [Planctomycetaceae bacterium]|nr:MAG: hypothetical protein Ct9H300mP1_04660 [Planctomycetaceae bacterium]